MRAGAQGVADLGGRPARDARGDDRAALHAEIVRGDAVDGAEALAQAGAELDGARTDRVEPECQGLAHRRAEAQHAGNVLLPRLETPGTVMPAETTGAVPGGGLDLDHEWIEAWQHIAANPQEAGAARSAQELPARAGEHVAADLRDVERQLPDRLRGIEQVGNAGCAGDPADLGSGVDEAAAGRDVRHADQAGAVVDHRRQARRCRAWPCSSFGTTSTSTPHRSAIWR